MTTVQFPMAEELATHILRFAGEHTDENKEVFFATANDNIHTLNTNLGYFPPRDPKSLTTKYNLSLVCRRFFSIMQPILLETVHLSNLKHIDAFHNITKPGALMQGRHVKALAIQIHYPDDQEDKAFLLPVLQQLTDVFGSLRNLRKLDLTMLSLTMPFVLFCLPNGPELLKACWNAIPKSLTHIKVNSAMAFPPFIHYGGLGPGRFRHLLPGPTGNAGQLR